jgi:hypothetical protein
MITYELLNTKRGIATQRIPEETSSTLIITFRSLPDVTLTTAVVAINGSNQMFFSLGGNSTISYPLNASALGKKGHLQVNVEGSKESAYTSYVCEELYYERKTEGYVFMVSQDDLNKRVIELEKTASKLMGKQEKYDATVKELKEKVTQAFEGYDI